MDASHLTKGLAGWMRSPSREHSHIESRGYLGMSGIGYCPRDQYWRVVDPTPPDDRLHWYNWIGYTIEEAMCRLLRGAGFGLAEAAGQLEIVADFDPRFRGHIDHLLIEDRTVVEIKSTYWAKFVRLRDSGLPMPAHYDQVQMYMRHGNFPQAVICYVARDIPHRDWDVGVAPIMGDDEYLAFWLVDVQPDPGRADELDAKAQEILYYIDLGVAPSCECNWCKR